MWKDDFQFLTLLSTKLRNTLAPNSLDKLMQLVSIKPHIYDLDKGKITDLDKFQKKPYSLVLFIFKDFKIKNLVYLFGHAFLCPCYLMTPFYYLGHPCFFSLFLSQRKIPIFCR